MTDQTIQWLRGLADKGGKGVVNNVDARCLGRVADKLETAMSQRIRQIQKDFVSGDIDRMTAIEMLQDEARSSVEAERLVEQWEESR